MDILHKLSSNDPLFTHLDLSSVSVNTELLRAIANKLEENGFVIRVSWKNGSHYDSNLKKKIDDRVELNFRNLKLHPTDMIHALLSKHVYSDSEENDNVRFSLEKHADHAEKWNKELEKWRVFKVFNHPDDGGYYGIAYLNECNKYIVLAHRGTKLKFIDFFKFDSPLKTDLEGILGDKIVSQQKVVFVATRQMIEHAKERGCNLSFTGHSLGAWLAELSLYFAVNNFDYFQCKAVTFDSPGSVSTMDNFETNVKNHETNRDSRHLDVTTYLSAPNIVNCCNSHIGKVYRVFPDIDLADTTDGLRDILKNASILKHIEPILMGLLSLVGHKMTGIVATFDINTGKPVRYERVIDWPCVKYQPVTVNTTFGKVINETLESLELLKFLPGFGRWVYDLFPKPTLWTLLENFDNFLNGNIDTRELWKVFEHLEFNAHEGYPQKNTVSLSPEEQFALFYEGHYCTQEINPFKDIYNSNTCDLYLHQLFEISHKKISKKDIDENIKRELKCLKDKYSIKIEGNKKYICVSSSDIQVDTVREDIVKLCKRYEEINKILQDKYAYSSQNEQLNQPQIILSDLPHCSENSVKRPKVLDHKGKYLDQHRRIAISAFGGTGKSTIAKEYGRSVKENFKDQVVRFIVADSSDKINDAYRSIVENELNINIPGRGSKDIMQIVHCSIAKSNASVLFIFDNAECSKDLEPYIGGLYNIERCKVIITTRNKNLSYDLNVPSYELDLFTKNEAQEYVNQNSASNRFSPTDIEYLIYNLANEKFDRDKLGTEKISREILAGENPQNENFYADSFYCETGSVLPYSLSHAVAYLNQNKLYRVERYIESLKSGDDPTDTFLLLDLLKKSDLSFQLLQFSAYLDPDFICLDIYKELFSVDDDALQIAVNKLESLSLIKIRRQENNLLGIQLHRLVQHLVKKYARAKKRFKIVTNEKNISRRITQALGRLFPTVSEVPNDDWPTARRFYLHAIKTIPENIRWNEQIEILDLYRKMGVYCNTVSFDHLQALIYHERHLALAIHMCKHENKSTNLNLDFTTLGLYEKAKERFKSALKKVPPSNRKSQEYFLDFFSLNSNGIYDSLNVVSSDAGIALRNDQILLPTKNLPHFANTLRDLCITYVHLNEGAIALKYAKEALKMTQAVWPNRHHPDIACSFQDIGFCYNILREGMKAIKYGLKALEMNRALYQGQSHSKIATSLQLLGTYFVQSNETEKGLKYREEALEMMRALYPGQNHPDVALSLIDLGSTWTILDETAKGLKYMIEALEMRQALYPGQKHPHIAASLRLLARTYNDLHETEKALNYAQAALEMDTVFYQGQPNSNIATSLHYVGMCQLKLNRTENALTYEEEALRMRLTLHRQENHPDTASSYHHISLCYERLNEIVKALNYAKKALYMRQALYSKQNHPDVASSFQSIGHLYGKLNNTSSAIVYSENALEMMRVLYRGENRSDVASCLKHLSTNYGKLQEISKALTYEKDALVMMQALYPEKTNADIISSLQIISQYYRKLENIAEAINYEEAALEMVRAINPGENRPDIISSLQILGNYYGKLGKIAEVVKYEEDALGIMLALNPGGRHPNIVLSIQIISQCYKKLDKKKEEIKYGNDPLEIMRTLLPGENRTTEVVTYGKLFLVNSSR